MAKFRSQNVTYQPETQAENKCTVVFDVDREPAISTVRTAEGPCHEDNDCEGSAEPTKAQDNNQVPQVALVIRTAPPTPHKCFCCGVSIDWIDIRANLRGRCLSQRARKRDKVRRPPRLPTGPP
jgi:hypothetical protein